jgi:hypothetical protein
MGAVPQETHNRAGNSRGPRPSARGKRPYFRRAGARRISRQPANKPGDGWPLGEALRTFVRHQRRGARSAGALERAPPGRP